MAQRLLRKSHPANPTGTPLFVGGFGYEVAAPPERKKLDHGAAHPVKLIHENSKYRHMGNSNTGRESLRGTRSSLRYGAFFRQSRRGE